MQTKTKIKTSFLAKLKSLFTGSSCCDEPIYKVQTDCEFYMREEHFKTYDSALKYVVYESLGCRDFSDMRILENGVETKNLERDASLEMDKLIQRQYTSISKRELSALKILEENPMIGNYSTADIKAAVEELKMLQVKVAHLRDVVSHKIIF